MDEFCYHRPTIFFPRCPRRRLDNPVLEMVRLEDLPERVGGFEVVLDWADVLSLGEQQRLAFARLLINRPGYAVLDEATSALDVTDEANLYHRLQQLGINYISVGHRTSIVEFRDRVLELQGPDKWRLLTVSENRKAIGSQ